eukprot:2918331-Pyramimonas_sp.AAC.2
MGISRISGQWQRVESQSMGPGRAREQRRGGAGEMMRLVNERHHMYMMSSRSQTLEHTFYNASGHSSCIDYLFHTRWYD